MVDFAKLRTKKVKTNPTEPTEIFRRLPKPPGINDLYTSQAEVLQMWHARRQDRDVVLKLHTGGGKTLVGLLIAQSTMNELQEPVLYLAPTKQLMNQTLEKAKTLGILAVPYKTGEPLNNEFVNGNAIMVCTYQALFNGRTKFGLRNSAQPQKVSAIILDDAHTSFSIVREAFTLNIKRTENFYRYESLAGLFRNAFKELDRLGTFDDILSGSEYLSVLEVPYWAWNEKIDVVREELKADAEKWGLIWPLLRDRLHLCHALISRDAFTLTPILPLVNDFPTFFDSPRRIYMSATIADDSEIVRTFNADPQSVQSPLVSRSLAGISERMILIPELMPFKLDVAGFCKKIMESTSKQNLGTVVLVPSHTAAISWSEMATIARGSEDVEKIVSELQSGQNFGPVVFANRYDGIDLHGDSCRLLIMSDLPAGTSNYELFRANALQNGAVITQALAQRVEQGIGRGARGAGDYCVVLLVGYALAGWIAKDTNFQFFTNATKAQLQMGEQISKEIQNSTDLSTTIDRSFKRDSEWIKYHAETLAELVNEEVADLIKFNLAVAERKAINLWQEGHHSKAISTIEKSLNNANDDMQTRGWLEQLAARIADKWGHSGRAKDLQREAYAHNPNLLRPQIRPPYRPLAVPGAQAQAIAKQIAAFRIRRGLLPNFEEIVSHLHKNATSNQFEKALAELATMIGLTSQRHDINGQGPDVLWLLPNKIGFIIEAKSRKKEKNAFTKNDHGQLLISVEWFKQHYPDYAYVPISVLPKNQATSAAIAEGSYALTYEKLELLVSNVRAFLSLIGESQLSEIDLQMECDDQLSTFALKSDSLLTHYLVHFEDQK